MSDKDHPAIAPKEPVGGNVDDSDRSQEPRESEQVQPEQEPQIKASDLFRFTKGTLSAEARDLLAKIDKGGIPLLVTENLERIARSHGIEVSRGMTPDEIIRRLRKLS